MRKNDYKLFRDEDLSPDEITHICSNLTDIANRVSVESGLPLVTQELFEALVGLYGAQLVGVVFDPAEGTAKGGPYIGSIAAFDCDAYAFTGEGVVTYFMNTAFPGEMSKTQAALDDIARRGEGRRFVLILERSRLRSDYARREMARLNKEFFGFLREHNYLIVSACRESTSYKTYLRMALNNEFRFFFDYRCDRGYIGVDEPFHLIFGEFI